MEARTDKQFRGLNLFELMLFRILREEVLPKWPNFKRARMVSVNVAVIEKRLHRYAIVPNSKQVRSLNINNEQLRINELFRNLNRFRFILG